MHTYAASEGSLFFYCSIQSNASRISIEYIQGLGHPSFKFVLAYLQM